MDPIKVSMNNALNMIVTRLADFQNFIIKYIDLTFVMHNKVHLAKFSIKLMYANPLVIYNYR